MVHPSALPMCLTSGSEIGSAHYTQRLREVSRPWKCVFRIVGHGQNPRQIARHPDAMVEYFISPDGLRAISTAPSTTSQ